SVHTTDPCGIASVVFLTRAGVQSAGMCTVFPSRGGSETFMEQENFEWALRNFCRRRRFFPFYVELVSGDRFLIPHPEALVSREGLAVFARPDRGFRVFDSASVSQLYDQPLGPLLAPGGASGPSSQDQTS